MKHVYVRNYHVPWSRFQVWVWRQSTVVTIALGFGQKRFTLNFPR